MKPDIRFKDYLIPLIRSGEKILTYRKGNKYAVLEPNDVVGFVNGATNKIEGKIKIIDKHYTSFEELPFEIEGHEKYKSKQHQKEAFEGYYGEISDDEQMLVLKFEVIE